MLENEFVQINNLLFWPGAYVLSLALLTPLVRNFFRISRKFHWLTHIPEALLFGIFHHILTGIFILLGERLFEVYEHYTFYSLFYFLMNEWHLVFQGSLWYIFIIICLWLLHYKNRYEEKTKELTETQQLLETSLTEALSARLNPHFLFNAMNNINMLIRKNENKKAIEMSAALSSLLRRSMTPGGADKISLDEEIRFLKQYINLEMLKHEENVKVNLNIRDKVANPKLPQMLLQPLVENAFKHGVDQQFNEAEVTIDIYRSDDKLILEVFNSGVFNSSWNIAQNKGIGLHHTVHRLRQQYGSDYLFQIKEERHGVRIKITLPYEE
ncbi:MAG: sensor histidine kinase [Candidatus Cyclobacteriaceae bacterium M2_1C_046]